MNFVLPIMIILKQFAKSIDLLEKRNYLAIEMV